MKVKLILVILPLAVYQLHSQEYFNVTLPKTTQHGLSIASDVTVLDNCFWSTVHQYHIETNNGVSTLVKLSVSGDTLLTKKLTLATEVSYGARVESHANLLFVTTVYKENLESVARILMVCFSNTGDELWRKIYTLDRAAPSKIVFSSDNYIYISGTSYNSNPDLFYPTQFYVLKCDITDGSVIWTKKINPSYYSGTTDMIETSDGNLLICGWSRRIISQQLYEIRVVMLDPDGNILWDKNMDVPGVHNGDGWLVELPDGSFLCSTIFFPDNNNTNLVNGRLVVFDNSGEIVREKVIQHGDRTVLKQPILNSDGTLVVLGSKRNHLNEVVTTLNKYDPNLEEIWQRTYFTREDMPNYTYNMSKTNNEGFVFCGSAANFENNFQRAWIVKTDCFGCDSLLCYYEDSTCLVYDCNEYPTNPQFTVSEPVFSTSTGTTFTFTQNQTSNTTMRYWDLGDGTTQMGAQNITHTYTQAGTYTVKLRSHHSACYDEFEQMVVVTQNIGESYANDGSGKDVEEAHVGLESWEQEFRVYPNPAENELFVEFPNVQGSLTLVDLVGKAVLPAGLFHGYAHLNLSGLSAGVYVLRICNEFGTTWFKQVVLAR